MDASYYKKYEPIFGAWKIKRKIGEGNFGAVFEIEREDFGTTYHAALKTITVPKTQAELDSILDDGMDKISATEYYREFVEKIVGEFVLMSKLKGNSNIVSYEDHQVIPHEDGIGWDILIRMELLTPMTSYIKSTTLTKRDVIKLGIDMCRALELCQKYNIIHRDIKPENIFISDSGDFKLGDFGIAREIEKTQSGMTKTGTQSYMAPEVYKGQPYGSSVDIYSLGIVLYRLLNHNRAPFMPPYPEQISYSDRERALIMRMGGHEFPKPSDSGDSRLAEIAIKAASFHPEDRYSSPTQMREDLQAILYTEGEGLLMFPSGDNVDIHSVKYISRSKVPDATEVIGGEDTVVMGADDTVVIEHPMTDAKKKFEGKKLAKIAVPIIAAVFIAGGVGLYAANRPDTEADESFAVESEDVFIDAVEFTVDGVTDNDRDTIIKRLEAYGENYYSDGETIVMEKASLGETNEEILKTINIIAGKGVVEVSDRGQHKETDYSSLSAKNLKTGASDVSRLIRNTASIIPFAAKKEIISAAEMYVYGADDIEAAEYSGSGSESVISIKMTRNGAEGESTEVLELKIDGEVVAESDAQVKDGYIEFKCKYARVIVAVINVGELSKEYEISIDEKYGLYEQETEEVTEEEIEETKADEEHDNGEQKQAGIQVKTQTNASSSGNSSEVKKSQSSSDSQQAPQEQPPVQQQPVQQEQPQQSTPAQQQPQTSAQPNNSGMPEIYIDFD